MKNTLAFLLVGILVSHALGQGHVCLPLRDIFTKPFVGLLRSDTKVGDQPDWSLSHWRTFLDDIGIHSFEQLIEALSYSVLVCTASTINDTHKQPMVLIDDRLYLRRYFDFEQGLITYIKQSQRKEAL